MGRSSVGLWHGGPVVMWADQVVCFVLFRKWPVGRGDSKGDWRGAVEWGTDFSVFSYQMPMLGLLLFRLWTGGCVGV